MEQITNTISEISKIEEQASLIIQNAVDEKQRIAVEVEQRKENFNASLQDDIKQKISDIREELKSNMSNALSKQRDETIRHIDAMQQEFDQRHSEIANEILKSMIGA